LVEGKNDVAGAVRLEPIVVGGGWLAAIVCNVALVPSNAQLFSTYNSLGFTGQLVAITIVTAYIALSCIATVMVSRTVERSRSQQIRDELFLFAGIGIVSIVPWSLISLMRGDHSLNAPLLNPLWVLVPSLVALSVALASLAISRSRTH
jgi:hypothetical protein